MYYRPPLSRRRVLAGLAATSVGLAGCIGDEDETSYEVANGDDEPTDEHETDTTEPTDDDEPDEDGLRRVQPYTGDHWGCDDMGEGEAVEHDLPLADEDLPVPTCPRLLLEEMIRALDQDGIPAIDDPQFSSAEDAADRLDDDDPVFGMVHNGEAKAYPQHILVWHEIVNDEIGGLSIAATYCPLTGTAQAFERGSVEFGVSGRLSNSNLVMYDRATESLWPQMLARSIEGPLTGASLREEPMTWTTWARWRRAYPETRVLTEDTGYIRNYDRDPYGEYNPISGYYGNNTLLFEPFLTNPIEDIHPKAVVIGARSPEGAIAIRKSAFDEQPVIEASAGEVAHVGVADHQLNTASVYRNPQEATVEAVGEQYAVDGEVYPPSELPFERVLRYDGMWFSWVGYYPTTQLVY